MQNKWTAFTAAIILIPVLIVPFIASQGPNDPGFWMWFSESITPEGEMIGILFNWVLLLCGVLFVGIHAIMIYFAVAYRKGVREETPDTHGHLGIEITWTIIPTIIMVVLGIYTFNVYSSVVTPPKNPLKVNVSALQFAWRVQYPGTNIELSNQMVLPTDQAIRIQLESQDVLHSFFVPQFRMKQDAVPGMNTYLNIREIQEEGTYPIKCAELCGVGHYRMMADLTVVSPEEFKTWKSLPSAEKRRNFLKKVVSNE